MALELLQHRVRVDGVQELPSLESIYGLLAPDSTLPAEAVGRGPDQSLRLGR